MRHRYATREDVAQWYGGKVPATMRALVIEDDGELIAIAGLTSEGLGTQAFSEVKPRAKQHPVALGRMVAAFAKMMESAAAPVLAMCNPEEPTSPGLLRHLGFEQLEGAIWRRG